MKKYTDLDDINGYGANNWIVLRYADVALMLAEVKMHLSENDAVSYLNMVRERAGLDDYSGSSLRDAILRERRVEFAFEGQYWYDLLRLYSRQELLEHMKAKNPNFSAKDFLLPIPYDEHKLDPTRMYQNVGYMYYGSFSSTIGDGNLDQILAYLSTSTGLIIDVRSNGGGSLSNVETLVSRFINRKTVVGYISHKTGFGHQDFSELYPIEYSPSSRVRYQKPVVVLANRGTFSAGNNFVSVMKALKVRDGSPLDVPIMQFSWDKEKAMHVYLGEKPKEEKDKRKEDELVAVAKEVFSRRRFVTYVELAEEIQSILEVKERTAKSYIRFMREKEIILKSSDNQSYYVIGNF